MEEIIKNKAIEILIDKTDWKLTKFGEVAIQQKKTVDRDNTSLTKYVKGEHMGSEDLHLREWGELTDEYLGPAFIRYFEKDDILYGSRRTYLRKVVIAPFEGITSNTTFVIKANEKKIDKRLLPFIMMTDDFTEHSVRNSKGSVNPYINWKDISEYEFLLPPKDQQAQLAELLWAMDEVIEKEKQVNRILTKIKEVELRETFKLSTTQTIYKLKDLCKITSGDTAPQENKFFENGNLPFIRMQHLNNLEEDKYPIRFDLLNDFAVKDKKLKLIKSGSILLAKSGESIRSEKKAILRNDSYVVNHLAILQEYRKDILNEYLFYFFQEFKLSSLINQTTTPSISLSDLGNIKVPLKSTSEQRQIINKIQTIDNSILKSRKKLQSSQSLQKSLINQVF